MSFIDKYYAIFNNSVGKHSVIISRAEFANLLGVFSKQEQQLDQLKAENEKLEQYKASKQASYEALQKKCNELELENRKLKTGTKRQNPLTTGGFDPAQARLNSKYFKFQQTLTEIKEFVENEMEQDVNTRIILNKISEVLDEEV